MNQMNEELEKHFGKEVDADEFLNSSMEVAFTSMDYEFVCAALAIQNPVVDIQQLIPAESGKRGRQREDFVKYVFVLVGEDPNWYTQLEDLRNRYMNGKLLVEPNLYNNKRRAVRAMMRDRDKVKRVNVYRANTKKDKT